MIFNRSNWKHAAYSSKNAVLGRSCTASSLTACSLKRRTFSACFAQTPPFRQSACEDTPGLPEAKLAMSAGSWLPLAFGVLAAALAALALAQQLQATAPRLSSLLTSWEPWLLRTHSAETQPWEVITKLEVHSQLGQDCKDLKMSPAKIKTVVTMPCVWPVLNSGQLQHSTRIWLPCLWPVLNSGQLQESTRIWLPCSWPVLNSGPLESSKTRTAMLAHGQPCKNTAAKRVFACRATTWQTVR